VLTGRRQLPMEGSHITLSGMDDAQEVKRTGRWTWRPESVALIADISEDAVAGVTIAVGLKVCG
jgi:hypothetical protein